jgi:hypothetical protein
MEMDSTTIRAENDKKLTRLICSIDKSMFTCNPALVYRVKTACPQSRHLINLVSVDFIRGSFCPPATRDLRT